MMIIDVDFRTFSASKFLACTKTRVGRILTCCNEKSIKVLGDPLILGVKRSKVKVKKYKSGAGVGFFHSCECQLLLLSNMSTGDTRLRSKCSSYNHT